MELQALPRREGLFGRALRAGECGRVPATVVLTFVCLYFVTGETGAPGGLLFAVLFIYVLSFGGGLLVQSVKLPSLVGMLIAGIVLRNLPYIGERIGGRVDPALAGILRHFALTLILSRAGLAFDVGALKRLLFVIARLACLPALLEAATMALFGKLILGFPLPWAAMLGFVIAPISPAVVVPGLLSLQEQGYGKSTGIATMIVAAAPLDDVLSIAGFGICLNFAKGGSGGWMDFARVPAEVVIGCGVGMLAAGTLALFTPVPLPEPSPPKAIVPDGSRVRSADAAAAGKTGRLALLSVIAVACAFGLKQLGFSGAAALSVLVLNIGAAQQWGPVITRPIAADAAQAWNLGMQPLLFGLVGAGVSFQGLKPAFVALCLALISCGLLVRFGGAFLAISGRGLQNKEKLFAALAWLPKATVQAALGGVALDEAKNAEERRMANQIFTFSVIAILLTAPMGAIAINALGPKFLSREEARDHPKSTEDEAEEQDQEASSNKNAVIQKLSAGNQGSMPSAGAKGPSPMVSPAVSQELPAQDAAPLEGTGRADSRSCARGLPKLCGGGF